AADISAAAGAAAMVPATSATQDFFVVSMFSPPCLLGRALERVAHAERIEVAVLERVGARAPARGLSGRDGRATRRHDVGAAELLPPEEVRVLDIDQLLAL